MNYRFKQNIYELSKTEYIQEDWYYKVYTNNSSHSFLRRNEAYDYYSNNNGNRIELIDKGTRNIIKVIVDREGIDINKIRDDFSIKKTSQAKIKAIAKYNKNNTKQIALKLNINTDRDILDYLNRIDNKNGLLKDLLRDHIEQEKDRYNYTLIHNQVIESRYKQRLFNN